MMLRVASRSTGHMDHCTDRDLVYGALNFLKSRMWGLLAARP